MCTRHIYKKKIMCRITRNGDASKTPATVGFAKTTHNDETRATVTFRHFE